MAGKQMTALEARKKALLLESELNRLRLLGEIEQLREATDLTRNLKGIGQRLGPWALALAPLAGVALARGLGRFSGGGGILSKTLAVAPGLIRLWRAFSKPTEKSE